jgi:hypothetical protein
MVGLHLANNGGRLCGVHGPIFDNINLHIRGLAEHALAPFSECAGLVVFAPNGPLISYVGNCIACCVRVD